MFHFYLTMPFYNFYSYNSNILEFLILEKDATFCPDLWQNIKKSLSGFDHLQLFLTPSASTYLWEKANLFSSNLVSSSRELWDEWGGHERDVFIELSSKLSWAGDSSAQDGLALKCWGGTAGLLSIWSTVLWHLRSWDTENTICWMWFPMSHVTVTLFTQLPALKFLPLWIPSPSKKSKGT